MKYRITATIFSICLTVTNLLSQAEYVDTTDTRYQVGYKIGTYLPVTIIILLAIFFIRRAYRFKE